MDYRYEHPRRGNAGFIPGPECWQTNRGTATRSESVMTSRNVSRWKRFSQAVEAQLLESLVEQRTSELRKLSVELMQAQDEERRRIARELHDSFGQNLASLKINLDQLANAGSSLDLRRQETARNSSQIVCRPYNPALSKRAHSRTYFILRCWMRQALLPRRAGTLKDLPNAARSM